MLNIVELFATLPFLHTCQGHYTFLNLTVRIKPSPASSSPFCSCNCCRCLAQVQSNGCKTDTFRLANCTPHVSVRICVRTMASEALLHAPEVLPTLSVVLPMRKRVTSSGKGLKMAEALAVLRISCASP